MRPNIRVEIQNNLVESAMDVDENEEGELTDDEKDTARPDEQMVPSETVKDKATHPSFTFSAENLDKKTHEKLQERAKRFSLNPEEIKNFRDEDLHLLYTSLGITSSNETNVRFEVIHMRGIEQMNAGDILDYFLEYAPVSVEWIDEGSCNVVWIDKISSARALHFMSKPVRGMPVRDDSSYFDNMNESEQIEDQSVIVLNKNRQVELQEDTETVGNNLLNETNSVDISEITLTIPPGYWRLGNNNCFLLRFGSKTDKKAFKTEQFSRYYKTEGKKTATGIFGRNKEIIHRKQQNEENPWSVLAKNWDEDCQFREQVRDGGYGATEPKIEIKNQSLRVRLGTKRQEESTTEEEKIEPPKKIKIPRMKMYADEEEEKIKRKKLLKKIDHQIKKIDDDTSSNSDLRTLLNMTNRTHGVKIEQTEPEVFDLGSRLKNRNKKMIFEIKSEEGQNRRRRGFGEVERSTNVRDRISRRMYSEEEHISRRKYSEEEHVRRRKYSDEEHLSKRKYSDEDHQDDDVDEDFGSRRRDEPRSKVAVVIKTQKKPTVASAVASTVWSRMSEKSNHSESESEEEEDEGSKSESDVEEDEEIIDKRTITRPGFAGKFRERPLVETDYKSPLKIEINNDHFKRT